MITWQNTISAISGNLLAFALSIAVLILIGLLVYISLRKKSKAKPLSLQERLSFELVKSNKLNSVKDKFIFKGGVIDKQILSFTKVNCKVSIGDKQPIIIKTVGLFNIRSVILNKFVNPFSKPICLVVSSDVVDIYEKGFSFELDFGLIYKYSYCYCDEDIVAKQYIEYRKREIKIEVREDIGYAQNMKGTIVDLSQVNVLPTYQNVEIQVPEKSNGDQYKK